MADTPNRRFMADRLGEILVKNKLITTEQLDRALKLKLTTSKRLGDILVEEKMLTEKQVVENLYSQLAVRITSVLKPMADAETSLSAFYMLCAKAQPERTAFWNSVSRDELHHAANIDEMIEIIYKKPHLFKEGRIFREAAIKTFVNGINIYVDKLMKNEVPIRNLLYIARDFENTMIETKYAEAIISDDPTFNAFIEEIKKQDEGHKQKFISMIKKIERNKI